MHLEWYSILQTSLLYSKLIPMVTKNLLKRKTSLRVTSCMWVLLPCAWYEGLAISLYLIQFPQYEQWWESCPATHPALSCMAFVIHCSQLCTWWGYVSHRAQGKFATGTQCPAKKQENLACTKVCVTKTKLHHLQGFLELIFMNTCL